MRKPTSYDSEREIGSLWLSGEIPWPMSLQAAVSKKTRYRISFTVRKFSGRDIEDKLRMLRQIRHTNIVFALEIFASFNQYSAGQAAAPYVLLLIPCWDFLRSYRPFTI